MTQMKEMRREIEDRRRVEENYRIRRYQEKMEENQFWVRVWSVIVTGVVLAIFTFTVYEYKENCLYVENGYEQSMEIGRSMPLWKKIKP